MGRPFLAPARGHLRGKGFEMETLKLISGYATMINPFLAAVLSGWNAYDARYRFWRCLAAIVVTLVFIGIGCLNIMQH
jgi:hypothetical protein